MSTTIYYNKHKITYKFKILQNDDANQSELETKFYLL